MCTRLLHVLPTCRSTLTQAMSHRSPSGTSRIFHTISLRRVPRGSSGPKPDLPGRSLAAGSRAQKERPPNGGLLAAAVPITQEHDYLSSLPTNLLPPPASRSFSLTKTSAEAGRSEPAGEGACRRRTTAKRLLCSDSCSRCKGGVIKPLLTDTVGGGARFARRLAICDWL